jgi:hypothetical protein
MGCRDQLVEQPGFNRLLFTKGRHASRLEQGIGFVLCDQRALLVQPQDDGYDALASLGPGQALALAHLGDDRGFLVNTKG